MGAARKSLLRGPGWHTLEFQAQSRSGDCNVQGDKTSRDGYMKNPLALIGFAMRRLDVITFRNPLLDHRATEEPAIRTLC